MVGNINSEFKYSIGGTGTGSVLEKFNFNKYC